MLQHSYEFGAECSEQRQVRERSIIIDAGGVQAVHVRRVDHQLFQTFDIVLTATQRLRPGKSTTVASLTLNQRCFACSGSPHAAAPWSSLQTDVCAAAILVLPKKTQSERLRLHRTFHCRDTCPSKARTQSSGALAAKTCHQGRQRLAGFSSGSSSRR